MTFPAKVKEEALVASARRCCVCKQFKGVKVDVHHIIPEEKGGENSFNNAIVLCFDCHADAGHYYAKHPKGNKYSPSELKKHRDAWYESVKYNNITINEVEELIHCRYFITHNPSLIKEIAEGNFSRFPLKKILVHKNTIFDFQKRIIKNFELEKTISYKKNIDSIKNYHLKYPDAKKTDEINYPYYSYIRIPKKEEIIKACGNMEVCKFLLNKGGDITDFFKLLSFVELCGGSFQEVLQIRPVWACFLCITNISKKPLKINSIKFNGISTEDSWINFTSLTDMEEGELKLPKLKFYPDESVVVPILTLLAPFENNDIEEISTNEKIFDQIEVIKTTHVRINKQSNNTDFYAFGPGIIPKKVYLEYDSLKVEQELHQFNLSNMFIYNREFMCGCCPHVFFKKNNKLKYCGEVFTEMPDKLQMFKIITPNNIDTFILCELEHEKTFILDLKVNNKSVISNRLLEKGESIKFIVKEGDIIEGTGYYSLKYSSIIKPYSMNKNNIIKRYILENSLS